MSVVLFSGHLTDAIDRPQPRFPEALVVAARAELAGVLDRWEIGAGDLGVCGAARGGDILFAELCIERGAAVHLCVALPHRRFLDLSVRTQGTDWEARYHALLAHPLVTAEVSSWPEDGDPDEAFLAANLRMIESARERSGTDGFRVLLLWDERRDGIYSGGTWRFVELVEGLAVEIAIVNPLRLRTTDDQFDES